MENDAANLLYIWWLFIWLIDLVGSSVSAVVKPKNWISVCRLQSQFIDFQYSIQCFPQYSSDGAIDVNLAVFACYSSVETCGQFCITFVFFFVQFHCGSIPFTKFKISTEKWKIPNGLCLNYIFIFAQTIVIGELSFARSHIIIWL